MEFKNKKMKDNTLANFGYNKLSKINELNSGMTIKSTPQDDYTRRIKNIKGVNANE